MKIEESKNTLQSKRQLMSKLLAHKIDFPQNSDEESYQPCLDYRLILVSPSHKKECGIGRYSSHAAAASISNYKSVDLVETTYQALRIARFSDIPCVVIFQHEYSLVDFQYDLGEDDTTSSVICNFSLIQQLNSKNRTAIFMHSVLLHDHGLNRINRQIFSASIPIFHANREGCAKAQLNFTELGIPSFGVQKVPDLPQQFTVGAFGFLSPNKDVRSTLELCANAGVFLRANYAPNNTGSAKSIIDAQNHVLQQVKEMNVSARITFDFMTDDDLRSMVAETSVIYAPQHDFSHYATSASVRFPLAVGRGAIVPPYKCFHDVAAGVQFAQLPEAIQIVKSMAANHDHAKRLAQMGLDYANRSEIGKIYKKIGERLIDNQVWCGGNVPNLRLPVDPSKLAKRLEQLNDHDAWSQQNEAGRAATGKGLQGGFFVYDNARKTEVCAKITKHSAGIDNCNSQVALAELLAELLMPVNEAKKDLQTTLGGNSDYISIVEISALPSYILAIFLIERLNLSIHEVARLLHSWGRVDRTDQLKRFLMICENFSQMQNDGIIDAQAIVWGHSVLANIDWMRDIVFPHYLLALPEENFISGVYRSLLRRDVESPAADGIRKSMSMGMKKSHIIYAISKSEEGQGAEINVAGEVSDWLAYEESIFNYIEMAKLIAPYASVIKSENLALRGRIYANVS